MALCLHSVTFDCRSPASLARFWASITGYEIGEASEFSAEWVVNGGMRHLTPTRRMNAYRLERSTSR